MAEIITSDISSTGNVRQVETAGLDAAEMSDRAEVRGPAARQRRTTISGGGGGGQPAAAGSTKTANGGNAGGKPPQSGGKKKKDDRGARHNGKVGRETGGCELHDGQRKQSGAEETTDELR